LKIFRFLYEFIFKKLKKPRWSPPKIEVIEGDSIEEILDKFRSGTIDKSS